MLNSYRTATCMLAAAALLALFAGGCGAASSNTITINGNELHPPTLTVSAGTTVTWINQDQTANTVTSDGVDTETTLLTKAGPGKFNSGPLNPGESFSFKFSTPGIYKYSSVIHGYITGTVIVK